MTTDDKARRSLRRVYVAAVLALVIALGSLPVQLVSDRGAEQRAAERNTELLEQLYACIAQLIEVAVDAARRGEPFTVPQTCLVRDEG